MIAFEVLTLFPEVVATFAQGGLLGKAIERGLVDVHTTNYRDFTSDTHRTVDDTPFGGGAGMVMKPGPVVAAIEAVEAKRGRMHRVLLTPSAPRFDQRCAVRLSQCDRIGLLCGRYEGIDDRVREHYIDECISIGDFVLNGGEVAALAIIEAVSRLREGVLGNTESIRQESFTPTDSGTMLEYPQYTRPAEFRGHAIPAVLTGGNHAAIARWREEQARARTFALRPDLRAVERFGSEVDVHLVVPAELAPPPDLEQVLRSRGVTTVVVLGKGSETAIAWAKALGGRTRVSSVASLRQLRKRLKLPSGALPSIVALVDHRAGDRAATEPAPVLDALHARRAEVGAPLIVAIPGVELGLEPDALYAPHSTGGGEKNREQGVETQAQTLASQPGIADASRPPQRLVELIDTALAGLCSAPARG